MAKDPKYQLREQSSEGLALFWHPRYEQQLWAIVRLRKSTRCVISGQLLKKGDLAYKPLTNLGNRYHRIKKDVVEREA